MSILVKKTFNSSLINSIISEISTRQSRYFFFIGKTNNDGYIADRKPIDSYSKELEYRNDIVLYKEINPTDVCPVVPRVNWTSGVVYDEYNDALDSQVLGINVLSGGLGYNSAPTITLQGGGGTGATAVSSIDSQGRIVSIKLTNKGINYTSAPTVVITGSLTTNGTPAQAVAMLSKTYSQATSIENANCYVITNEYDVFKCLDNNGNSPSTQKPYATSIGAFRTSDGYVWKFMYRIPMSYRHKFLSYDHMPVLNALNDGLFTNGSIRHVAINSSGSNYTWARLLVTGDGYNLDNPFMITSCNITNAGTNYSQSNTTVSVSDPISSENVDATWTPGVYVYRNSIIKADDRFYRVLYNGTLGALASNKPTHRFDVAENGTTQLKYIAETAKIQVEYNTNKTLKSATLLGRIQDLYILDGGSGYNSIPQISISSSNGDGGGASAICYIQNGSIYDIDMTSYGQNYTTAPLVIVGIPWTRSRAVAVDDQLFYGEQLYTVTETGITGATPPTHTSGEYANGTCKLRRVGRRAILNVVMGYGFGYTSLPSVTIQSTSGSGGVISLQGQKSKAKLVPLIDNGNITNVFIKDGGVNYTTANISVVGDGTGAQLNTSFYVGDFGDMQSRSELTSVSGAIHKIQVISGGYGFNSSIPSVTIVGDGTGAQARAVLSANGDKVEKIIVTSFGRGYNWADIVIGGQGKAASARAVMSPFGGHGSNPLVELNPKQLLMYSKITKENIFGFRIDNECRQVGIIKNPKQYSSKSYVYGNIHTPCIIVSGDFEASKFAEDSIVRETASAEARLYRVIAKYEKNMMLQPIQNYLPTIGSYIDNMKDAGDYSRFVVNDIIEPTINKYSGELLYIENRNVFNTSDEESVVIRTLLTLE